MGNCDFYHPYLEMELFQPYWNNGPLKPTRKQPPTSGFPTTGLASPTTCFPCAILGPSGRNNRQWSRQPMTTTNRFAITESRNTQKKNPNDGNDFLGKFCSEKIHWRSVPPNLRSPQFYVFHLLLLYAACLWTTPLTVGELPTTSKERFSYHMQNKYSFTQITKTWNWPCRFEVQHNGNRVSGAILNMFTPSHFFKFQDDSDNKKIRQTYPGHHFSKMSFPSPNSPRFSTDQPSPQQKKRMLVWISKFVYIIYIYHIYPFTFEDHYLSSMVQHSPCFPF